MKKINKKPNYKPWIVAGAVVLLVIILYSFFAGNYNGLVSLNEETDGAWGNVQTQYQRRADLIPNLVSTVKGFASHEQDVFLGVTKARSQWNDAASGSQEEQMAAAKNMDSALSRLLVTVEAYPQLKSDANFLALQDELAGTENRINVARVRYNNAVKVYNKKVKRFPSNIIANMFGFEDKQYFKSDNGSETAPTVKF